MNIAPRALSRLALATLAGAIGITTLAATPAAARSRIVVEYRDRDYRDWRRDHDWRRDRDWRDSRWGRDRGYYGGGYYGYYDRRYDGPRRCWTEWRWDGWRHERYPVRYCR